MARGWTHSFAAAGFLTIAAAAVPAVGQQTEPTLPVGDGRWASVSGEVASIMGDGFYLDYGEGVVFVEMNDRFGFVEEIPVDVGSEVTVQGAIDNDLYEERKIEASTVYSQSRNTFYYASAYDDENGGYPTYPITPPINVEGASGITVSGEVSAIEGRKVMVEAGGIELTVDTSALDYDPTDDIGFPALDEGDLVQVTGSLSEEFLEDQILRAETVTLLNDRRGGR